MGRTTPSTSTRRSSRDTEYIRGDERGLQGLRRQVQAEEDDRRLLHAREHLRGSPGMGGEEVRIRQERRRPTVLAWRGLRAPRLPDRVRRRGQSAVFDHLQNHAPLQRPRDQILPLRTRAHDLIEPWRVQLRDNRRVRHIRERRGRQHELHHEPRRVPHRGRSGSPRHHPRPGRREPPG